MYLYGASGHAKVIIDILRANNEKLEALFDPHIDKANSILSFRVDDENETTEEQQCNSRQ